MLALKSTCYDQNPITLCILEVAFPLTITNLVSIFYYYLKMAYLPFKLERVTEQIHQPISSETESASNKQMSKIITKYGSIIVLHGMRPR